MAAAARRASLLVPALGFAALGAVLFVAPGWAADALPWRVSAFLAMTMGAWYLGTSVFAWTALADPHWPRMHPALLYLWLFSLGQAALLAIHEDVLDTGATLAWPSIVVVGAAGIAAVAGIAATAAAGEWRPHGPASMPWPVFGLVAAFVVAVAVLALPLVDGYDSPRSIWVGELTLLSARAFAVFFGAPCRCRPPPARHPSATAGDPVRSRRDRARAP